MIHPSYADLMRVVNAGTEFGEEPVVNSRYSIVIATAKRARQIIAGDEPMVAGANGKKPLSIAVDELNEGMVKILAEDAIEEEEWTGDAIEDSMLEGHDGEEYGLAGDEPEEDDMADMPTETLEETIEA